MSQVRLYVKCPRCGFSNGFLADQSGEVLEVCCDLEEGGCDKYFIVKAERQYDVQVMKSSWMDQRECPKFGGPPF